MFVIDFDAPAVEVPLERPLEPASEGTFGLELPADAPHPPAPGGAGTPVSIGPVVPARTLPSYAVILIGGLALVCLALSVALVAALSSDAPDLAQAAPEPPAGPVIEPLSPSPDDTDPGAVSPADFPADPAPIPIGLITQLEAASEEPLEVELSRLLEAIQHGFGTRSARLEPTLRSYVYRMSARFEWNPNTFRVAVTAPDVRLAEARKALLDQLFPDAVATGRLEVGVGAGPHALTLVTE